VPVQVAEGANLSAGGKGSGVNMLEEIVEVMWGPLGLAILGLVVLPDGRKYLRNAAKAAIHIGLDVSESVQDVYAEARDRTKELLEEVRAEKNPNTSHDKHKGAVSKRGS